MEIQAPTIHTDEALVRTFENMWKVFQKNEPEFCRDFLEWVKQRRGSLIHANAMSEKGHFMAIAEIPARIDNMMNYIYGKNWKDNPRIANPFYRVFEQFRINQSTNPAALHHNQARDTEINKEDPWKELTWELAAS